MVCPLGDNTSTEVDVGHRIDLVITLFEEENVGEGDFSQPGLSPPDYETKMPVAR
jgi:hypothetical protein